MAPANASPRPVFTVFRPLLADKANETSLLQAILFALDNICANEPSSTPVDSRFVAHVVCAAEAGSVNVARFIKPGLDVVPLLKSVIEKHQQPGILEPALGFLAIATRKKVDDDGAFRNAVIKLEVWLFLLPCVKLIFCSRVCSLFLASCRLWKRSAPRPPLQSTAANC